MQVTWYEDAHRAALAPLVRAVAALGGAVGWLEVPAAAAVEEWADGLVADGARLAVAVEDGRVLGCGAWRRYDGVGLAGLGEVRKVMTHPDARGRGVARQVMELLVADARESGIEVLTLDCRGNNHGAQRLYASLGFSVTGRRPNVIQVGDERFDQVLMHRDLRTDTDHQLLVQHGSRREGPGAT